MNENRESAVTAAFVSLASGLAKGDDVVEMLSGLTWDCVRLLDVAAAGLLLADRHRVLHVLAASSEATRSLELFQVQRDEGPCRDCYRSGEPVSVADLSVETDRWPQFVPAARAAGFVSVHAVPMRLRDNVLGALNLFGTRVGALNPDDLSLAQALADVASVALVQNQTSADKAVINEQLQTALNSRVLIEQAKGVIAQSGGLDMDQSFVVLRSYARSHNRRLTDVARAVVTRDMSPGLLLDHALAKQVRPTPDPRSN